MSTIDENANLPVESNLTKRKKNLNGGQSGNPGKTTGKERADDQKLIKEQADDYVNRNKNKKKKKKNKRQRNKKKNGSNDNEIANKLSSDKVADVKDGKGNDANEGKYKESEEITSKFKNASYGKNFALKRNFVQKIAFQSAPFMISTLCCSLYYVVE